MIQAGEGSLCRCPGRRGAQRGLCQAHVCNEVRHGSVEGGFQLHLKKREEQVPPDRVPVLVLGCGTQRWACHTSTSLQDGESKLKMPLSP